MRGVESLRFHCHAARRPVKRQRSAPRLLGVHDLPEPHVIVPEYGVLPLPLHVDRDGLVKPDLERGLAGCLAAVDVVVEFVDLRGGEKSM